MLSFFYVQGIKARQNDTTVRIKRNRKTARLIEQNPNFFDERSQSIDSETRVIGLLASKNVKNVRSPRNDSVSKVTAVPYSQSLNGDEEDENNILTSQGKVDEEIAPFLPYQKGVGLPKKTSSIELDDDQNLEQIDEVETLHKLGTIES